MSHSFQQVDKKNDLFNGCYPFARETTTIKQAKSHVKCYLFTQAECTDLSVNFKVGHNF